MTDVEIYLNKRYPRTELQLEVTGSLPLFLMSCLCVNIVATALSLPP